MEWQNSLVDGETQSTRARLDKQIVTEARTQETPDGIVPFVLKKNLFFFISFNGNCQIYISVILAVYLLLDFVCYLNSLKRITEELSTT